MIFFFFDLEYTAIELAKIIFFIFFFCAAFKILIVPTRLLLKSSSKVFIELRIETLAAKWMIVSILLQALTHELKSKISFFINLTFLGSFFLSPTDKLSITVTLYFFFY